MENETIFQNWIFRDYVFPFLLIFLIVFALLEKTKLLGENSKQINAGVSFIIAFIFVGVLYPKEVVGNMILFLTIALVILFVFLLLYAFAVGEVGDKGFKFEGWMKPAFGILIFIAVVIAALWATDANISVLGPLFNSSWSPSLWTNVLFIISIAAVLAIVLRSGGK